MLGVVSCFSQKTLAWCLCCEQTIAWYLLCMWTVHSLVSVLCMWTVPSLVSVLCMWTDHSLVSVLCMWTVHSLVSVLCMWTVHSWVSVLCMWTVHSLVSVLCVWTVHSLVSVLCMWTDHSLVSVLCMWTVHSLVSLLCMWTVHSSSPVFFERNSLFPLKALAYLNVDLLLLLFPEYAEHKFGSSAMHVQFVLQNALNWPRWNYHQTSVLRTLILVFSRIYSFTWSTFKYLFPIKGCTERSLFSAQVTLLLNLKYTQNSHCLPSNSPFNILKTKFDSYILYFQQSYVVHSFESGNS